MGLPAWIRRIMDQNELVLYDAGFIDGDGNVTAKGYGALQDYLWTTYRLEMARCMRGLPPHDEK